MRREAFQKEKEHQGTLNKALRRIIRDCNDDEMENPENRKGEKKVLLPRFSCHILRHTFTTRLCESGMNIKAIQDVLGHSDVSTTLNIYADATREMKEQEFASFNEYLQKKKQEL